MTDQAYLPTILEATLLQPYLNTSYARLATKAYNSTLRGVAYDYEAGVKVYRKSMAEVLLMSDEELLNMRNFGRSCLRIFQEAVQPLRDKFIAPPL